MLAPAPAPATPNDRLQESPDPPAAAAAANDPAADAADAGYVSLPVGRPKQQPGYNRLPSGTGEDMIFI